MSLGDPATLSTPAGDTEFNQVDATDGFLLTLDTTGFDAPELRPVVDDRAQTDGYVVHPALEGGHHLAVVSQYLITVGSIADRDASVDALLAQLKSIKDTDGTWTQHRPLGDRYLVVRYEIKLVTSGGAQLKQVAFGLVTEQTWTDGSP